MRALHAAFLLSLLHFLFACSASQPPIPIGDVPDIPYLSQEDEEFGNEVFRSLSQQFELETDDKIISRARRVVDQLTKDFSGNSNIWHVYVFRDAQFANAAATRGNYIFIWTPMMDFASTDAELATILSHEIAHVLAGHTMPTPEEEVSTMVSGIAGVIAEAAVYSAGYGYQSLGELAGQLTAELIQAMLINPGQQGKELEADHIGLFLMADSQFDPADGVKFWKKAAQDPNFSSSGIDFLSSHPSTEERAKALQRYLPEAEHRYRAAKSGKKIQVKRRDSSMSQVAQGAPLASPAPTASSPPSSVKTSSLQKKSQMKASNSESSWTVSEAFAFVYREPNSAGQTVAQLRRGDTVQVLEQNGDWITIAEPAGYMKVFEVKQE
jgi:predicted Zn-dependent protease